MGVGMVCDIATIGTFHEFWPDCGSCTPYTYVQIVMISINGNVMRVVKFYTDLCSPRT